MEKKLKVVYLILVVCCIFMFNGCKKKSPETVPSEPNQVKEQAKEAIEAGRAYIAEQKDAVVNKANETFSQMQGDTKQLISNLNASGKEAWQKLGSELESKLTTAKQKLDELKEASGETMQKAGDAFNAAMEELKQAYQKAKTEYQKTDQV